MRLSDEQQDIRDLLLEDLFGESASQEDFSVPEVEEVLSYAGHHLTGMSDTENAFAEEIKESDLLKDLAQEYKNFLVWGEQYRTFYAKQNDQQLNFASEDRYFDEIRESMKQKTLTECILESTALIDKACAEIELMHHIDEELFEEQQLDILRALAPENYVSQEKERIPALLLQEFYKPGIDTLL
ncbi:TagK domain-containing protein [Dryocola clanedunensis]|uniref:TagK domain-containing protein n=1 Tax=Cedecea sulfonylureivorans TaxID=3051154 RepID=UPI001927AC8D|nr:TagK domain-containing protein [Cedecea sulfonylureivorans]